MILGSPSLERATDDGRSGSSSSRNIVDAVVVMANISECFIVCLDTLELLTRIIFRPSP